MPFGDLLILDVPDDMTLKVSNGYPFPDCTRRRVIERLASEREFLLECVKILDERRGWMASHRSRASKTIARLAEGNLSAEDITEAIALASCYARTLARIFRERELAGRPELLASAAVFGVVRSAPASALPTGTTVQAVATPAPVVDTPAAVEPVVAPKRRGRPPGVKTKKPRSEPEQPPKRRRRRS